MTRTKFNRKRQHGRRQGSRNRGNQAPTFNIKEIVNQPGKNKQKQQVETRAFAELQLSPILRANLDKLGYTRMTEIQHTTFDQLMNGQDVLGIANTGTGKTVAFLLPIIERLMHKEFQSLVIAPTRELALQIQQEFFRLTKDMKLFSTCLVGGTNVGQDIRNLKRKNHLIIGTPGRIIDLMDRRALSFKKTEVLVLDEFDRMLDMGFVQDVKQITQSLPAERQTLLFSATEEPTQKKLIHEFLNNPFRVAIHSGATISEQIKQELVAVEGRNKSEMLIDMLLLQEMKKVLVFAETRRQVDKLEKQLKNANIETGLIHGDKSQSQRNRALRQFKSNTTKVLVATDVAARGLDVADISHVINYQVPRTLDSYIHRIGRTGRAGKQGTAITFVD